MKDLPQPAKFAIHSFAYLLRLASLLFFALVLSRALIRFLPGDPIQTILSETGLQVPASILKAELKLDRPFWPAFFEDLKGMPTGNFGESLLSHAPIGPVLFFSVYKSTQLGIFSILVALLVSLPLGLLSANPRLGRLSKTMDALCSVYGWITAALPSPWLGPLLMLTLAVEVHLLPIHAFKHPGEPSILLPTLTLAITVSGTWARLIRERVREMLLLGAAPGARARGSGEIRIMLKYGLAPAAAPLLAYLGTQAGFLLGGVVVTETVFNWPGLGTLLVNAILTRDYPVFQAAAFVTAALALLGSHLGEAASQCLLRKKG